MTALFACAERRALYRPSFATRSPFSPSSCMATLVKGGGDALSTRQNSVAEKPLIASSVRRALIVIGSVDFGTIGKCVTSRMRGGMLLVLTELTRPGVPLVVLL